MVNAGGRRPQSQVRWELAPDLDHQLLHEHRAFTLSQIHEVMRTEAEAAGQVVRDRIHPEQLHDRPHTRATWTPPACDSPAAVDRGLTHTAAFAYLTGVDVPGVGGAAGLSAHH